jgi:hypothetical protein
LFPYWFSGVIDSVMCSVVNWEGHGEWPRWGSEVNQSGDQELRLGRSEVEASVLMIALLCSLFCLIIQCAVCLKIQDDPFKYVS